MDRTVSSLLQAILSMVVSNHPLPSSRATNSTNIQASRTRPHRTGNQGITEESELGARASMILAVASNQWLTSTREVTPAHKWVTIVTTGIAIRATAPMEEPTVALSHISRKSSSISPDSSIRLRSQAHPILLRRTPARKWEPPPMTDPITGVRMDERETRTRGSSPSGSTRPRVVARRRQQSRILKVLL